MKNILLSTAALAFAGTLSIAKASNNIASRDSLAARQDTASILDTASRMDTAAFFIKDTASMDTASRMDTAAFFIKDTASMDTASRMDTAAFFIGRDTASAMRDTALNRNTTQFMTPNDTALTRDTVLFAARSFRDSSSQKTPVQIEQLPASVKSTLNSAQFQDWMPSAAYIIRSDTSAYYQVAIVKGTEEKNVNIDETGAVVR
jgi:hypothetical protein